MPRPPVASSAEDALATLRRQAAALAALAHVPYSKRPEGAALLLADGSWVGGTRVESVAFPLTIPALQAAYVGALGAGRQDIVAAALSRPALPGEWGWLGHLAERAGRVLGGDLLLLGEVPERVGARLDLRLDAVTPAEPGEGVALARGVAGNAHVPFSGFQVGCVLLYELAEGGAALVPGVNVEHPDWTRGLCAERSAIAGAHGLGRGTIRRAYLSCLKDPDGTPCGACRQLLVEMMPDGTLAIDRGSEPPERSTPRQLLPRSFSGDRIGR